MRCLIVIPARMGSVRFPGKPLCDLMGKPMVQWVYEASAKAGVADDVVVATPDDAIVTACKAFGGRALLTSAAHPTGTDRIAEVAQQIEAEVYVNVQGDEPLIAPESIATCARILLEHADADLGSVYCDCKPEELDDPACVKVVTDMEGFALYFSRWAIPYPRNERAIPVKKHLGLYAYRRIPLEAFAGWQPSPLEVAESLEQLRFMEHGLRIAMAHVEPAELAVDTPEQAQRVREILQTRLT